MPPTAASARSPASWRRSAPAGRRRRIVIRADSGFCRDDLMTWCEANDVRYVLGLAGNSRLVRRIAPEMRKARLRAKRTGQPARVFADFEYRTRKSWSAKRRVIGKAEWTNGEANPRFIVTNVHAAFGAARFLYEDVYCQRGEMENRLKECQGDLFADRTPAPTMRANQLRLWLVVVRLRADVRGAPHRACRHQARGGDLRHHPAETAQDRRARHDQRPAREARVRFRLSRPRDLHAGRAPIMNAKRLCRDRARTSTTEDHRRSCPRCPTGGGSRARPNHHRNRQNRVGRQITTTASRREKDGLAPVRVRTAQRFKCHLSICSRVFTEIHPTGIILAQVFWTRLRLVGFSHIPAAAMINSQQLTQLGVSLAKLGVRKLALLGVIGVMVMIAVGVAAYYLGRPAMQPIYTGLSSQDVTRITAALAEVGVAFDVNEQRNAVMVPFGQTARARTLLAQKGLPTSARAGYELFDQLGSIGLTSFMQEITRVRALEGEIARTIQALDGVGAARVHLVLSEAGTFRKERRDATASVLLRVDEKWNGASGQVVRHIVAAAVPGMKLDQVSVASTDGRMLVAGGDEQSLGSHRLAEMEKSMAAELEQRAGRTLASTLGGGNFQISATVRLDVDRQQVNETIFDPKSRIERSVRVVKQSGSTEEGGSKPAVGVEANVPKEEASATESDKRRQREDRREELTNYELNSKTVQTVREGYRIQKLAIAVVVSRKHVANSIGPNADASAIDARLADLNRLISAATGANPDRDRVEITAVDLGANASALAPVAGPGFMDYLILNTGTAINALTMLLIVVVVIWFGVKPISRILSEQAELAEPAASGGMLASNFGSGLPPPMAEMPMSLGSPMGGPVSSEVGGLGGAPGRPIPDAAARDRLAAIVEFDDVEVTKVLKKWMLETRGI